MRRFPWTACGAPVLPYVLILACPLVPPSAAAELEPRTAHAYDQYLGAARQAFLGRVRTHTDRSLNVPTPLVVMDGVASSLQPQGRVVKVPGGLVHHWTATTFIAGVRLDRVLGVARAYDAYADIYTPIVASRLLGREGNTYRIFARLREDAGVVSAVLDVWSVVSFERRGACTYSLGHADKIRQVKNPGQPDEEHLAAGRDSGYLWRADTFTRFIERNGGVEVELETLGLSRSFPPFLGWIIEPIARRLGRASVERTLSEFRDAVLGPVS